MSAATLIMTIAFVSGAVGIGGGIYMIWRARHADR